MEIETLAAWGELIGGVAGVFAALGVIATLFYFGRQISQSVQVAKASQNQILMASWERFNSLVSTSPELADLLVNLHENKEVSPRESVQARHLTYQLMNLCSSAHYAHAHGQIDAEELQSHKDGFEAVLNYYPGLMPFALDVLEAIPNLSEFDVFASIQHYAAASV